MKPTDYKRFRKIADECGSYLMMDMAHISGLVASGLLNSPFPYCDIVTTTTHKTLRGPRSGMIFYRLQYKDKIDKAVFPGLQGGPHNHQIAALATQLLEVQGDNFKEYSKQVIKNAKKLSDCLMSHGYKLSTDGTDNHTILWDLRPLGLTGSKLEFLCDYANISINKNTVPGDKSALSPSGVRLGTSALTTRGFKEYEFEKVGEFLKRAVDISLSIQEKHGKKLDDFKKNIYVEELEELKNDVNGFAKKYYMP